MTRDRLDQQSFLTLKLRNETKANNHKLDA